MLTQVNDCKRSTTSNRIETLESSDIREGLRRLEGEPCLAGPSFRLLEQGFPLSLAEQFPRLLIFAVAASILLAAITAEIDCLRGAGYYWP